MGVKNLYETLGVQPSATAEELRKAYRELSFKHHPDRNPGDQGALERFREASEAYAILSDPSKRALHDLASVSGGHGRAGDANRSRVQDILDDLLNGLHGQEEKARPKWSKPAPSEPWAPAKRGTDATAVLEVTLSESVSGCKKPVKVRVDRSTQTCRYCMGQGGTPGTRRSPCTSCGGIGRTPGSSSLHPCLVCRGRGSVPLSPCGPCGGRGTVLFERDVVITVPKGVHNGDTLRAAGMGGPGSPPGDLFIEISVKAESGHPGDGLDVMVATKVSLRHALLGGSVTVTLPDGTVRSADVPAGSQPGDEVRVRGGGLADPSGRAGDLVLVLTVALPRVLSPRARKLVEELVDELSRTEVK